MSKEKQIKNEKEKIISDICPLYKEYGTCEQCNADLDIDDEPCYFECMANAIINNGYGKQNKGEWARFEVNSSKGYGQVYYHHKDCEINATQLFPSPYHFCPNCGAKMKGGDTE
jgi:hypothetical protein